MVKNYRYHLGDDGVPRPCRDKTGRCPYGESYHFQTKNEARLHYEFLNETPKVGMRKNLLADEVEMKTMGPQKLAELFSSYVIKKDLNESEMNSALFLASYLHQNQSRGTRMGQEKTAYIEHPLRNAIRIMRWGITDEATIKAALLHDTVEDTSLFFAQIIHKESGDPIEDRNLLFGFIEKTFSFEVKDIVAGVTNPHLSKEEMSRIPRSERDIQYGVHVEENIKQNPKKYVVKLTDFFDNAGSLPHQDFPGNEKATVKRARKYLLVVPVFKKYSHLLDRMVSKDSKNKIMKQLEQIESNLENICEKYKDF